MPEARNGIDASLSAAGRATAPPQLFVIQNPAAGTRSAERLSRRIGAALRSWGIPHAFAYTRRPGHAAHLAARALESGTRRFLVAGGDGTVLEVVSVLAGTDAALALLPVGTGNQLAANLGIPRRLARAVRVAVNGRVRKIDVGMINDHPFTCVAGAGFDAEVVRTGPRIKRRLGYLAYVYSAARAALSPRVSRLNVRVDGQEYRCEGIGVEVANVPAISGPWLPRPVPIIPEGVVDDGCLEVCIFAVRSTLDIVLALFSILTRRFQREKRLRYYRGRDVTVEADPPLPVQADGERVGETPFRVTIRPRALNVVVPSQS